MHSVFYSQSSDDVERLRRQATQMFLTTRHQISQEDTDSRATNRSRAVCSFSYDRLYIDLASVYMIHMYSIVSL